MPIYEYECSKCGVFDEMQKITAKPRTKCPTCKRKVKKLMSSTAFQLKGSGWYVTDYGKAGQKPKEGSGDSASSSSSSAGEGKNSAASSDKKKSSEKKKKPAKKDAA
ncbi:MAG: FmdB family zinc ribbon protein [Deltaproteobacteria bacterium]